MLSSCLRLYASILRFGASVSLILAIAGMLCLPALGAAERSVATVRPGDGVQTIYALVIQGSDSPPGYEYFRTQTCEFYDRLVGRRPSQFKLDIDPAHVRLLLNGAPGADYAAVNYGASTVANVQDSFAWLATQVDADDLAIIYINSHGNGYLSYDANFARSIALHGYNPNPLVVATAGDTDPDDTEFSESGSSFEWSVILAPPGVYTGRDSHMGMNQWGVTYYPNAELKRTKVVSSLDHVRIRGQADPVTDTDVYLERLTNYCKGDLNHNGEIDPGEDFDWNGNGIAGYDPDTGTYDEDDWEDEYDLEDDWNNAHSPLGGIPYQLFDANHDNHMDVDLYPQGNLEVDATDSNNDGLFNEGIDINDDGDMDDRFGSDEIIALQDDGVTDDQLAVWFGEIGCRRVFFSAACYAGGLCADLAGPGAVIFSLVPENQEQSSDTAQTLSEALDLSSSDANGDGVLTLDEYIAATARASSTLHGERRQPIIEDDGDGIPVPLPAVGAPGWGISPSIVLGSVKLEQSITWTVEQELEIEDDLEVQLTGTASSGLPVSYQVESGPGEIDGSILNVLDCGFITVTAHQTGDEQYGPAAVVQRTIWVGHTQTIQFPDPPAVTYGDAPLTLTATATSGLGVDLYVFSGPATISGHVLTATGAGLVTIGAYQQGSEEYLPATTVVKYLTVAKATQTITFDPLADQVYGAAPIWLWARASSHLPVAFSVVSGPATVSGHVLRITGAGTVRVAAAQAGDANHRAASVVQWLKVAKATQTITFNPLADQVYGAAPIWLWARASSHLPVAFSVVSGPATVSGHVLRITGAGTVRVAAAQAGDANHRAASVVQWLKVAKATQTITFNPLAEQVYGAAPIWLWATASSHLPVAFSVVGGPATVRGHVLTITGAGTVRVSAVQAGDANYRAAAHVVRSFRVTKATQAITAAADAGYGETP